MVTGFCFVLFYRFTAKKVCTARSRQVITLFPDQLKYIYIGKSVPITGLDRPTGFQEVTVPRFRDNGTGWW